MHWNHAVAKSPYLFINAVLKVPRLPTANQLAVKRVIQSANMWQHDTTLLKFHQGSNVLANFTINLHQRHLIIDSSVVAMKRPWSMVQSSNRIDILGMYILPRTHVLLHFPLNQQILVHFSQTAPSSFMEKQPENSTHRWIWSCFTDQPPSIVICGQLLWGRFSNSLLETWFISKGAKPFPDQWA